MKYKDHLALEICFSFLSYPTIELEPKDNESPPKVFKFLELVIYSASMKFSPVIFFPAISTLAFIWYPVTEAPVFKVPWLISTVEEIFFPSL